MISSEEFIACVADMSDSDKKMVARLLFPPVTVSPPSWLTERGVFSASSASPYPCPVDRITVEPATKESGMNDVTLVAADTYDDAVKAASDQSHGLNRDEPASWSVDPR